MFEDTGLYSQMRIQLYPRKVVYFMYLIRILISNNTMRSKHVFVHKGYDTRIRYKDIRSSKSEFTTGFPASKYMYKLVFTLSETFTRPLHEAMFTPTAGCRRALTPCASEQSRLRPRPSAAIWRACDAILGLNHEARCHGRPARGRRSITRPDLRRRRAP